MKLRSFSIVNVNFSDSPNRTKIPQHNSPVWNIRRTIPGQIVPWGPTVQSPTMGTPPPLPPFTPISSYLAAHIVAHICLCVCVLYSYVTYRLSLLSWLNKIAFMVAFIFFLLRLTTKNIWYILTHSFDILTHSIQTAERIFCDVKFSSWSTRTTILILSFKNNLIWELKIAL